jgi:hypothetical protein
MWIPNQHLKKWRSDSLEARIYAIAEAEAHANGMNDGEAVGEAMEAVYRVMSWLSSSSQKAVVKMVKEAYGLDTCASALSGFRSRLMPSWAGERMRRNAKAATSLANVISKEEEEAIKSQFWKDVRQAAFELMTNPNPLPEDYVSLGTMLLKKDAQEFDREKFAAAMKTKIELGLDALASTIKGNKEAERLYREFRKVVSEA